VYRIILTATFEAAVRKHARNGELVAELKKKLRRLQEAPGEVGARLHGDLHPYRSTRLARNYRLLFTVDDIAHAVTLYALDHRKDVYE
jgi:mRNA-degrading endonuclease RelE of RelBE toxin-antitoxin system